MNENQQWHYTDSNGQQAGPVPTATLQDLIAQGAVTDNSMVWSEGMDNWKLVSQIESLKPTTQPTPTPITPAPTAVTSPVGTSTLNGPAKSSEQPNLYASPQTDVGLGLDSQPHTPCGGIGRLSYFILSLVLPIGFVVLMTVMDTLTSPLIMMLGFLALSIALVAFRYKNIGHNPWWSLLIFVPIVSIVVSIRCLICQEGWIYTRKLDTAGRVISWILGGLFLLYVALIIVGLLFGL